MDKENKSGIPSVKEAKDLLKEAEKMNPGKWVQHSIHAAEAAQSIAKNCPGMDSDKAFVVGLLHDIGRRFGVTDMRHTLDGYNFCMSKGYDAAAKICITHSFICKHMKNTFEGWDCSTEEYNLVEKYIESIEYDDYDKLIQLCDALALPEGYVLMEKRMVDVVMRHGIHEGILPKWKATFETKKYFEKKMGKSIYSVLPGVIENTFNI